MAEAMTAYRKWMFLWVRGVACTAVGALVVVASSTAQTAAAPQAAGPGSAPVAAQSATATPGNAPPSASASAAARPANLIPVPRIVGRLRSADIGVVINTADPASVAVGEHYIAARKLVPEQVLRIELPVKPMLSRDEFDKLQAAIAARFDAKVQALALAWNAPYKVECNAITGALALGFDAELCQQSCNPSRPLRYFNTASARPFTEFGFRPSMLLAAPTVEAAKALIDRGVAADGAMLLRGRPPVVALQLRTEDRPRGVRTALYLPPALLRPVGVELQVQPESALPGAKQLLMAMTGSVRAPLTPAPEWVPGGLGDHLTSFGGDIAGTHGQGTVLDWIASGATASHGAVTEPCNHLPKFPHPQVLLGIYLQGSSAIEAYWKSVLWPQQSLFVGEPLAAPFGRR
jgi:uncharacterized protein (TIGR03790 family)